ncbi:Uncharacterised protein [Achromobacter insolitus]|nr:hypothetical protein LMG6003_05538 [Achromobacter insolitus]VEG66947.1 Uncharacterised protein [Achromobacter insolitus]
MTERHVLGISGGKDSAALAVSKELIPNGREVKRD